VTPQQSKKQGVNNLINSVNPNIRNVKDIATYRNHDEDSAFGGGELGFAGAGVGPAFLTFFLGFAASATNLEVSSVTTGQEHAVSRTSYLSSSRRSSGDSSGWMDLNTIPIRSIA
jgi:hypothetical protein